MKLILAGILFLIIALYIFTDVGSTVTIENTKSSIQSVQNFVQDNYIVSVFGIILLYTAATAVAFPGAPLLTIAAGAIFGWIEGGLYVTVGATLGAYLIFYLTQTYFRESFYNKVPKKLLHKVDTEIEQNSVFYLLFFRVVPVVPFFMLNIIPGLLQVKTFTYIWTTALGIIPGVLIYTFAGTKLATIESVGEIFSPGIIFALATLGALSIIGLLFRKKLDKKKSQTRT
jgi:uncharacterized membrane protein YdjX (TVP38/TMEM64 family)